MSKPYSVADFSAQISDDRTWRIKEISDLKNAIRRADAPLCQVLLRSLVAICYAHWEGYVRFAARKYLEHVALRKFRYKELSPQFLRNYFLPRLAILTITKATISDRCKLVDEILNSSEQRFARTNEDLVNTKSNLNFEVFTDICLVCDVSLALFEEKATFIDVILLKRRNAIAHGENTFVQRDDLDPLTNETIEIMRTFGDELENHVYLGKYRAVALADVQADPQIIPS